MPIYIIEHLEPKLWKWCLIEYEEMSKIVGKENLWFTNIKRKSKNLEKLGKCFKESIKTLSPILKNLCVLDPEADKTLSTNDNFDYFIFGGILGDNPPKKRTKSELTQFIKNAEIRNLGKEQLSTDNAVLVTKLIAQDKIPFEKIKFQNPLTIEINDIESTSLPYQYPIIQGKPHISEKLVKFLKRKRGF